MELTILEKTDLVGAFDGENGLESIIAAIENECRAFVPDLSTSKGRREIAALSAKVSKSKVLIDDAGKALVAEWKQKSKVVDASRKSARDRLDALRDEVRQPLTDWEVEQARIVAEKEAHEKMLSDWDLAIVENTIFDQAKEIEKMRAEQARIDAERLAKEQAEREEALRIEREKQIAEQAAKAAEERAARQIAEAKAAEERARREAIEAEQRAKEQAERAERERKEAIERERQRVIDEQQAAEAAKKAEEARRMADIEHKKKINNAALFDLMTIGIDIDEAMAKQIIAAIAKGQISNVTIKY